MATNGEKRWPPTGRFDGRLRGEFHGHRHHLAWFGLDAVAGMDLGEFYGAYRRDGVGRRAYDPAMMA